MFDFIIYQPKKRRKKMLDKRKWRDAKNLHLRHNNQCYVCGVDNNLEVHHIRPVSQFPELSYEPSNLVTLCRKGRNCHLVHGHHGNYQKHNLNILNIKNQ